MAVGVVEREVMRVAFEADSILSLSVVWYTGAFGIKVKSHGRYERVNS